MMTKRELRYFYKQKRALIADDLTRISAEISAHLQTYIRETRPRCIAAYLAAQTEPSLDVFLEQCLAEGIRIVVPLATAEGYGLADWQPGHESVGPYGIREPQGPLVSVAPDLWLVPGLAFDRSGARLGYGKGMYDRLLVDSSGTRMGVCPSCGVADALPREGWDVPMDGVVTELGILS